jgi:hypothetical protein
VLFYLAITNFRTGNGGAIADLLKQAAQKKTLAYVALGPSGWATAVVKGILCNWMVTIGTILALASRSTLGKIAAMWLPIMTFFALGFEHSVVNMFLIPSGMIFGAPISVGQFLLWNLLPVSIVHRRRSPCDIPLSLYVANHARIPTHDGSNQSGSAVRPRSHSQRPPHVSCSSTLFVVLWTPVVAGVMKRAAQNCFLCAAIPAS